MARGEIMADTYEIDVNELSEECDGVFGLLDTARHNGFRRTDAEIVKHIRECRPCFDRHGDLLN